MKKIKKYINEFTGAEFDNEKDALKSEARSKSIAKIFSFWKKEPKRNDCNFENGEFCYQRTAEEFSALEDALIKAIKKHERYTAKNCASSLKKGSIRGSFVGRYLCDGNSELSEWYNLLYEICPKCFRQHGQPYYAIHCNHSMKVSKL